MKKIITNVMFVAVAAMAFSACQKTEMVEPETSQEVMLTFASEKPAFEDETKTEWTGSTIQWSKDDKIAVAYTVNEIWQNANGNANEDAMLYKSEPLKAAAETAKFNVSASFKGTTEGTHVFYGVYPAPDATAFPGAPSASLNVPARQSLNSLTFDKSADLMTGVSVDEFKTRPVNGETISMRWTRLVAHAYITLKDIKDAVEGEIVSGITLTAQDGANLVGKQMVDIQKNVVTKDNSASNAVELANGSLTVDANGNVSFWVCVLPETLTSLKVVVETDKATYTREITGISKTFKQNARNTLAIKMNEATRVAKDTPDYSGEWLIVNSDLTRAANAWANGNNLPEFELTTNAGVILESDGIANCKMIITKEADGYTIQDASGMYLYAAGASDKNHLYGQETKSYWTIEKNETN